ncbi:hypothetical protein GCM10027452_31140 [Micromonospora halotolerans]
MRRCGTATTCGTAPTVRPPETFYRDRAYRDALRRRSQWEVRVAKYRGVPPPRDPQRCGYRNGPPPGW